MKSLAELQAIREKARAQISVREGQEDGIRILVGMATCGIAAGARPVLTAFIDELEKRGITSIIACKQAVSEFASFRPFIKWLLPEKIK